MRFIHLSDLHIGRQLHQYNLKEDQEHILGEVVEYARMLKPDAIVIAGDVYDKSVPSAEAVGIFDWFLTVMKTFRPVFYQKVPGGLEVGISSIFTKYGLEVHNL